MTYSPAQRQKAMMAQSDARDHFVNSSVDGKRMSPNGDILFKRPDQGGAARPGRPDGGILFQGGMNGMSNKLGG